MGGMSDEKPWPDSIHAGECEQHESLVRRVLAPNPSPYTFTGTQTWIVGAGSEIGDAFVSHDAPRVISFTGSTPVGRGIARLAADAHVIKRVDLELGGNSPLVVLDDADVYRAAATSAGWS